ncbi:MAG: chromosomal replication initiator protein DnaA [Clostridioides sp.]|jgi:chromosomal replication initiator protein|nr:chromosomal replication initiator protein DnaA [Clostridioides sp.]
MDIVTVWEKTLPFLKGELTSSLYSTVLNNIVPIEIKSNIMYLLVHNPESKEVLEDSNCLKIIEETVQKITLRNYKVMFILNKNEIRNNHKKEDDQGNGFDQIYVKLNPKYTFDSFVIGNSNRFAHAACVAVAEAPAKAYNPLFLYGGVGLGKTHLMQAIGHQVALKNRNSKIEYVSSETFTNELINSIKDDKNEEFRNKYRNVDILLIDDIQFIANKERTQEEFFHTFNALYEANKQIIISSDRPPKEIPTLEERLKTRFEMGLITDIQPPDFETRIAILRKKAQQEGIHVPDEVMSYIAEYIVSNIRELEGAMTRVIAFSSLYESKDISLELAKEALKDIISTTLNHEINVERIKQIVSDKFNIKMEDFNSKKRTRDIAYPRQIAMYLTRELTDMSLPKIGDEFGGRDHTTVMHACDKISNDINNKKDIKFKIENIISELKR